MNNSNKYSFEKIDKDSKYFKTFFELIKQTPELKGSSCFNLFLLKILVGKKGSDIHALIKNNNEIVGAILLSDYCPPRNKLTSKVVKGRTKTFDSLLKEGYKYLSNGFIKESERGNVNLEDVLNQIDEKFFTISARKGLQKLLKDNGGEEVKKTNGETFTHLYNENIPYIKYNPKND